MKILSTLMSIVIGSGCGLWLTDAAQPEAFACSYQYLVEDTEFSAWGEATALPGGMAECPGDGVNCNYIRTRFRYSECWGPGQETNDCQTHSIWVRREIETYTCNGEGNCVMTLTQVTDKRMHDPGC